MSPSMCMSNFIGTMPGGMGAERLGMGTANVVL